MNERTHKQVASLCKLYEQLKITNESNYTSAKVNKKSGNIIKMNVLMMK